METSCASRYGDLTCWHWWFRGRDRLLAQIVTTETARPEAPTPFPSVVSVGCRPPVGLAGLARPLPARTTVVGLDADPSGASRQASTRGALRIPGGRFRDRPDRVPAADTAGVGAYCT
jgi:hypothetical protein